MSASVPHGTITHPQSHMVSGQQVGSLCSRSPVTCEGSEDLLQNNLTLLEERIEDGFPECLGNER